MAFNREQARAAGYSDEEIDAYLQGQPQPEQPKQATVSSDVPPPPTTVVATPEVTPGNVMATALPMAGPILKGAADYALPAAVGGYGAYKLNQGLSLGREALQAMGAKTAVGEEANRIARMNAERLMNRPGYGGPSMPTTAPGPVSPPTAPSYAPAGAPAPGAYNAPTARVPMPSGPAVPAGAPAPAPAMTAPAAAPAQTVQQMAMQRLQQLGGMAQRVAPTLASAAPAAAIAAPFMAAGSRVADIQARPNAPEYATNPRAMSERSGGKMTTAQAGALNRRRAAAGFYNR
jgi:hypothetical protein